MKTMNFLLVLSTPAPKLPITMPEAIVIVCFFALAGWMFHCMTR